MVEVNDQALNPTHVVECYNVFTAFIRISNQSVVTTQRLHHLATVSAQSFCRTFHRLMVIDPTLPVVKEICEHYSTIIPLHTHFTNLPFHHTMIMIHALIMRCWTTPHISCGADRPPNDEYIPFAQDNAKIAQAEYQQKSQVPVWILHFAFDSLSLDPPPPASVVVACLEIIAIDLGCDVSSITSVQERCVFEIYWYSPSD